MKYHLSFQCISLEIYKIELMNYFQKLFNGNSQVSKSTEF